MTLTDNIDAKMIYSSAGSGKSKLTEVGPLPSEWTVVPLDSVANVTSGKRLPKGYSLTKKPTPYPYIRVSDMRLGTVDLLDIRYVPVEIAHKIKQYRIYKGDIFISVAGTLGIIGAVPDDLDGANLTENADRVGDIECSQRYLMHALMSPMIQKLIGNIRTVGAQPKLALTRIRTFPIPLPPSRKEQESIGDALDDADDHINALKTLIEKKRLIKKGAMQELLSGRRRLPGFSGDLTKCKFGDMAIPRKRRVNPATVGRQPFCVELEHISQGTGRLEGCSEARENASLKAEFEKGDVLFGKLRAYLRKYWRADRPGVCSTEFWVLAPIDNLTTSSYLYQLVQTDHFIEVASQGYGTHMPRSDWSEVSEIEFPVPALGEQEEIGRVLAEMDAEIEALEARLEKARQVKQGMMQELLTGRVRLV